MNDIKKYAEQYDWAGCKDALIQQLMKIDPVTSGNLCLEYMELYRHRFIELSGERDWYTIQIDQIRNSKLFSEDGNALPIFPDIQRKYRDAKLRTVRTAIFHFWSATRFYDVDYVRASKLAECLAIMILIFRIEHPEWVPDEHNNESIKSRDDREYGKFLWNELAIKLMSLKVEER